MVIMRNSCILHLFFKVDLTGFADGLGGKYERDGSKMAEKVWLEKLKE